MMFVVFLNQGLFVFTIEANIWIQMQSFISLSFQVYVVLQINTLDDDNRVSCWLFKLTLGRYIWDEIIGNEYLRQN